MSSFTYLIPRKLFLYTPASQSLAWGWLALTHWATEEWVQHSSGAQEVSKKGKDPTHESQLQGQSCLQLPHPQDLAFSPAPCFQCLQGVAADLLEAGLHSVNKPAKVCLPPLTSERAALFFTPRMQKPEIAHLWISLQGNNSCCRGLGYFFDIHHKNLCFCRHPKNKTKTSQHPGFRKK